MMISILSVVRRWMLIFGFLIIHSQEWSKSAEAMEGVPEIDRVINILENVHLPLAERANAAAKLGTLRAVKAIDPLIRVLLRRTGDLLTLEAVHALGQIGSERALPAVVELGVARDLPGKINAAIQKSFEQITVTNAQLLRVVQNRHVSEAQRLDAIRKLGEHQCGSAVDELVRLLPGNLDETTLEIVRALGEIGAVRALPVLQELKQKMVPEVLSTAIDYSITSIQKGVRNK